ncbi:MAG: T9SS type A sorting domain-containing protein, partial [Bacteroidales bacterium]|nr:T9SS type A sorting domain-containing protein [Bacteroidales bacterium]
DNLGGLAADRQIISTYIKEGDFDNAFTLAEMLPDLYELEGDELEEHDYYMDMLNLYQALEQQGRNTFQMNAQEKQQVEYIASASEGIAGSQAQNILEAVYGEHFYDCPDTEGEEGYKRSGIKPGDLNKLSGISLEVHPNPAKEWAAFDYTLPGKENQGVITITNARGKTVEKLPVQGKQGQKLWDTRTVEPGVYFYRLQAGGNTQIGKIVIAR